jgi:hypothetical protein
MNLLDLITSLDERGITIEVSPKFIRAGTAAPTLADAEAAKPYRTHLIRIALARAAMDEVMALEAELAGYPGRRTPDLEQRIQQAKAQVLYLLPPGLPWSAVARKRPDGTTVEPSPELQGVA